MEVLLDTNFIISCIRKRIDFLEELELLGFKIRVPREVLQEMKDLKRKKKISKASRTAIDVAFQLLDEKKVKKVTIGGRTVDHGLIERGKVGIYIATLDNGIKREIPNKVVIDTPKNRLKIQRK